jgi:hypothetical protein
MELGTLGFVAANGRQFLFSKFICRSTHLPCRSVPLDARWCVVEFCTDDHRRKTVLQTEWAHRAACE